MKRICETIRVLAVVVYNTTPGVEEKDQITDPIKLLRFSWEKPKIQTVDEMRDIILGFAHISGVSVTQHGKEVEKPGSKPEMKRTK